MREHIHTAPPHAGVRLVGHQFYLSGRGILLGSVSQENLEIVRRAAQNLDAFWALLDEHVVWDLRESRGVDLQRRAYRGWDAVIEASRHYWGTWDDYRVVAEEHVIEAGSSVVVCGEARVGRGKGSGVPIERQVAQLWTLRRGKLIRWEIFPDKAAALEAAGLSE